MGDAILLVHPFLPHLKGALSMHQNFFSLLSSATFPGNIFTWGKRFRKPLTLEQTPAGKSRRGCPFKSAGKVILYHYHHDSLDWEISTGVAVGLPSWAKCFIPWLTRIQYQLRDWRRLKRRRSGAIHETQWGQSCLVMTGELHYFNLKEIWVRH